MVATGKNATADGSVMVARSCDAQGDYAQQVLVVPRKKYASGEFLRVGFEKPGFKIPQVQETYAYIAIMATIEGEMVSVANGGINEYQVSAGASTGGFLNEKAEKACFRLHTAIGSQRATLVLERCKTAHEGIKFIGEMTEKYGAIKSNYIIADPNEVWLYEEYRGRLWAAVRVPDDCFIVQANTFRIKEVSLDESDNFMGSKDLIDFAVDTGLYKPNSSESFSPMKVYGAQTGKVKYGIPAPEYDRRRIWRSINLLAPSTNLDSKSTGDYPLFIKPDWKLTPRDLIVVLTDHYQGTKYDHYGMNKNKYRPAGVMRIDSDYGEGQAEAFFQLNSKRQYQMAPIWGAERLIGTANAVTTWCAQLRSWMPNPIGGLLWMGLAEGATSGHIPLYSGITKIPEAYTIGTTKRGQGKSPFLSRSGLYNEKSAYWTFRVISNLVNLFYTATKDSVIPIWRNWEDRLYSLQPFIDKIALEIYEENPDLAIEFITGYSYAKATEALEIAQTMISKLHTIIAKYNTPLGF